MTWGHTPPLGMSGSEDFSTTESSSLSARARRKLEFSAKQSQHRRDLAVLLDSLAAGPKGDQLVTNGPLQAAIEANPKKSLLELLPQMDANYLASLKPLAEEDLEQLSSIGQEGDEEMFLNQFLDWSERQADQGRLPVAALAHSLSAQWAREIGEKIYDNGKEIFSALARDAEKKLAVLQGAGDSGLRFEFAAKRILDQTMDPAMLFGFGLCGAFFKGVKLKVLSELLSRPAGLLTRGVMPTLISSGIALSMEAPAFVLTVKAGHSAMGMSEDWSAHALGKEILANGLTLLMLRSGGALTEKLFNSVHGIDPLLGIPRRLEAMTKFSQAILPQGGMYAGILVSHDLEARFGLRPRVAGENPWFEGLVTLLQFNIAGKLGSDVWGTHLNSLERQLDFWNHHLASQAPGFAPVLSELDASPETFPQIHWMESRGGDGNDKKGPKVVQLRPNHPTPDGETPTPPSQQEVRDFAEATQLASQSVWSGLRRDLSELWMRSQVYLAHVEMGRQDAPELQSWANHLATLIHSARPDRPTLDGIYKSYESLIFSTRFDPALNERLREKRDQLQTLRMQSGALGRMLDDYSMQLMRPEASQIQRLNGSLNQWIARYLILTPIPATKSLHSPATEIMADKARGMLLGVAVKEAFRPTEERGSQKSASVLEARSPRALDLKNLTKLLYAMAKDTAFENGFETLLHHEFGKEEEGPKLRTVLNHGGVMKDPFRGWLAVHLPALLAVSEGNMREMERRIGPALPLMNSEQRTATEMVSWWLSKAMTGRGSPFDWISDYLSEEGVSQEAKTFLTQFVSSQIQGKTKVVAAMAQEQGELAAIALALPFFLRHPFDLDLAMRRASQVPEALREDVLSLTGAMFGAFHGTGIFLPAWVSDTLLSQFGEAQRATLGIQSLERFQEKKNDLERALKILPDLWGEKRALLSRPPRLVAVRVGAGPNDLRPFEQEFADAKKKIVESIQDLESFTARAAREGMNPHEFQNWFLKRGDLVAELEAYLKEMRQLLNEEGSGSIINEQALNRLGRVIGLLRSEAALMEFYRKGSAVQILSPEDVLAFRELSITFRALLDQPIPGEEGARFRPWGDLEIRKIYEGQARLGKSLQPPRLKSPFFEMRSDWAMAQVVEKAFFDLPFPQLKKKGGGIENLAEIYLEALGARTFRVFQRSFLEELTPSAMLSVLLPAYLKVHSTDPAMAYRLLKGMNPSRSPKIGEVWRAVTYLSLRLLEGAEANPALLRETAQALGTKSSMNGRFMVLADLLERPPSWDRRPGQKWAESSDPRDQTMAGIQAFFESPQDSEKVLKLAAGRHHPQDREHIAERSAASLLGAWRGAKPAFKDKDPSPEAQASAAMGELISLDDLRRRAQLLDLPNTPGNGNALRKDPKFASWFDPTTYEYKIYDALKQWSNQLVVPMDFAELEVMKQNLDAYPSYFPQHLAFFAKRDPESFKFLCLSFGLFPQGTGFERDPTVLSALRVKAKDSLPAEELERISSKVLRHYEWVAEAFFPLDYKPMEEAGRKDFAERLFQLPSQALKILADPFIGEGQFLLLLSHWGLSPYGIPKSTETPK